MPHNRIVLIGASNLTMALPQVIALAQSVCGAPGLIFTAYGHGRSYGRSSQALFRVLPGVAECRLWQALDESPRLPTYALLTDIGNDIAYGYPPEPLLQWIGRCIERLQQHDARIVVTDLPLTTLSNITEAHFLLLRALFFPFSRLSRRQMLARVDTVSEQLHKMADRQGFVLCEQNADWYGTDAIHILKSKRAQAYRYILSHFAEDDTGGVIQHPVSDIVWNRQQRPRFYQKSFVGLKITRAQPSCRLADGSVIFSY